MNRLATRSRFTTLVGNVVEIEKGLWRIFTYGNRPNLDVRGGRLDAWWVAKELLEQIKREKKKEGKK